MRDRVFYACCFGFIFGVLVRSFWSIDFYFTLFVAVISLVLALFFIYFSVLKSLGVLAVFIFAFSLGVMRLDAADVPAPKISGEFAGIIVAEPDIRETNQKLTVKTETNEGSTKVLATVDLLGVYEYGDEVKISGKIEKPENFLTDQGKEFDYINYLRKDGIHYVMSFPEIEIISSGNGNIIKSALFSFKNYFLQKINIAVPAPESLLLGGLILGERSSFSQDMRQKFIDTGTIHIVALSGYNVSIVADWIMKVFSFLPRNLGFGAGILGIILFVIMAGGTSTAVRAGIMAVLVLIARATGRTYDVARALVLAGVFMILFNPFVLVHDVSFQLSFIATVAIIFLVPKIEKYFMWVPKKFGLREIISMTFSAYILVMPFILYKMGNISLVALPANILVLPFIPWTMGIGFLTGFFGSIFYMLGVPFGLISTLLLKYELWIIDIFAKFSFASYTIPNFPLAITLAIYACFIYLLFSRSFKKVFLDDPPV